jgi:putative transposase
MNAYQVRRVTIGIREQLDELAGECGRLYSQTAISFWRTLRHMGIWLKPKHLMRWHTSKKLHAHSADACVQAFCAAMHSWRQRRQDDPEAKAPHKRKHYFRIAYKRSAMSLVDGRLRLCNAKGNAALVLPWPWELPNTVAIHGTATEDEAIATSEQLPVHGAFLPGTVAGIDLGEVQMAAAHDGAETHILNGRLVRSKVPDRNKLHAKLNSRIDGRIKKGSKRGIRSKKKPLTQIASHRRDSEHTQTSTLITTLHQAGVQTLASGDVRAIRQGLDGGCKTNQNLHQWTHGSRRFKLTYQAQRLGMEVVLQQEAHTAKTCQALRAPAQEFTARARIALHEQGVSIRLAPPRRGRDQHPLHVSWGRWRPPRSRPSWHRPRACGSPRTPAELAVSEKPRYFSSCGVSLTFLICSEPSYLLITIRIPT